MERIVLEKSFKQTISFLSDLEFAILFTYLEEILSKRKTSTEEKKKITPES